MAPAGRKGNALLHPNFDLISMNLYGSIDDDVRTLPLQSFTIVNSTETSSGHSDLFHVSVTVAYLLILKKEQEVAQLSGRAHQGRLCVHGKQKIHYYLLK